jgi:hypothetical protein
MIAQTTTRHNVKQQPVQRVRKWVNGRYEWVVVTQRQVEATRRREQYVAMFDPCGMGGW